MHQKHRPEADARACPGASFEFCLPTVRLPAHRWGKYAHLTGNEKVLAL
jgi:hypothetical protein